MTQSTQGSFLHCVLTFLSFLKHVLQITKEEGMQLRETKGSMQDFKSVWSVGIIRYTCIDEDFGHRMAGNLQASSYSSANVAVVLAECALELLGAPHSV